MTNRRRMRALLMTGTALACAALLGACGRDASPTGTTPEVATAGSMAGSTAEVAVLIAVPADGGDGGDDAMVTGEVSVVHGCLGIGDDVAVWPHGTRVVDPAGPVIDVPGLGTVTVGDQVRGAGGYHRARDLADKHSPTVPDSCAEAGLVVYRAE